MINKAEIIDQKAATQTFFFEAMRAGYSADKNKKTRIVELPNYKVISYRNGNYSLLDMWCTTKGSSKSAGTTTIWFQENPVWVMQYAGEYDEVAIPTLKEALRYNYEKGWFRGGRGPSVFQGDSFTYVNIPRVNTFERFEGREDVFYSPSGNSQGFHQYQGMFLI